jgi:hypothetical protein
MAESPMTLPRRCEVSSSASVALLAERKTTKIEVTVAVQCLVGLRRGEISFRTADSALKSAEQVAHEQNQIADQKRLENVGADYGYRNLGVVDEQG